MRLPLKHVGHSSIHIYGMPVMYYRMGGTMVWGGAKWLASLLGAKLSCYIIGGTHFLYKKTVENSIEIRLRQTWFFIKIHSPPPII